MGLDVYFDDYGYPIKELMLPGGRVIFDNIDIVDRPGILYYQFKTPRSEWPRNERGFEMWPAGEPEQIFYDTSKQDVAHVLPNAKQARHANQLLGEGTPPWDYGYDYPTREQRAEQAESLHARADVESPFRFSSTAGRVGLSSGVSRPGGGAQTTTGPARGNKKGGGDMTVSVTKLDNLPSVIINELDTSKTDAWRDVTVAVFVRGDASGIPFRTWETWAFAGQWYAGCAQLVFPTGHTIKIVEGLPFR